MPNDDRDREEIFAAFREGDPGAVAEVRDWIARVVGHSAWRLADAESVVQDVLVKLLDVARSDRFERRSSFRTFAVSVARHTSIDAYRRQRWRERMESPAVGGTEAVAAAGDPEAQRHAEERRELLRYVYQKLPEDCRKLWRWVYGEGLEARQVAGQLGISEENVRVRVHRCL